MRSQVPQQFDLVIGEAEIAILSVQAEHTPTLASRHERDPELVTEPERGHHLSVAGALRPVAAGGTVERADGVVRRGQRGELVYVLGAELVVEELGRCGCEWLVCQCRCEQQ